MTGPLGVALCARFDLPGTYGAAFAARGMRLRAPAEIDDPAEVSFAVAFEPEPAGFAPYPNLRAIIGIGAGVERILGCPSRPEGMPLIRQTDDDQADQMAGFALWHVLYWHRRFDRILAAQREGRWLTGAGATQPGGADWPGPSPKEFPVGVLGFGFLGRRIAAAALTLGYPVRTFSRSAPAPLPGAEHFHGDGLDAFLSGTRALVAVLPHTPATEGMLDRELFERLPAGAVAINIGRGAHLVEDDLIPALDAGRLSGASLDVFATEPLPADHAFWADPRIVVTPHAASDATADVVAETARRALDDIAAGRRPQGLVDPAAGY